MRFMTVAPTFDHNSNAKCDLTSLMFLPAVTGKAAYCQDCKVTSSRTSVDVHTTEFCKIVRCPELQV